MSRTPRVTGPELISALAKAGFTVLRVKGSHYFLRHDSSGTAKSRPGNWRNFCSLRIGTGGRPLPGPLLPKPRARPPGRLSHNQLAQLSGPWLRGTVKGGPMHSGWGAAVGPPGLVLDPTGPDVKIHVFESSDPIAQVHTADGALSAWIYALAG